MKLFARLVTLFLLISLVPLCIIGYFGYRNGIKTIKQDTVERLISTNMLKTAEVNRWINDTQSHLKALAQRPLVRMYASKLVKESSTPREIESARRHLLKEHFKPLISHGVGFLDLFILSKKDGRIVAATEKLLEDKYREDQTFFIEGRKKIFVDDMSYEVDIDQQVMHISTPIKGNDGRTIAVLTGHMDWREMSQIMTIGRELTASEESYLVNKFHYFITESRFAGGYPFKKTIYTAGVDRCLAGQDGVGQYDDYRGVPIIGAYHWMPEWNLCILTEADQSEAFAPAVTFRNMFLGIGLLAALSVTWFSWLFARVIAGRVHRLVIGAEQIGKGNLDHRIETRGKDEIEQLARSFNDMASALKASESAIRKSHDELEERVKARTVEMSYAYEKLVKEIMVRKQIEGALRVSEEKYRDLVENLDTAVVVHEADASIIMSNPRALELLGLTEKQMAGKEAIDPAWYFLREDGTAMPLNEYPVNLVIHSHNPLRNYTVGINHPKADSVVWVSVNAFPKFGSNGQLNQVVVTFYDITFRKEVQTKLQRSLTEKEVLLREIHHRVKNNMQMIQSLISLQANKLDHDELKRALRDSNSRIKSMALIHETLYRSEDLANLNIERYFRQLVTHIVKLYLQNNDSIDIVYDFDPLKLDMDSSIACGLIVSELVTNALKYAFENRSQGKLSISLRRTDDNQAELAVMDNGKGLSSRTNKNSPKTLGLKIVTMLAEDQLQGRMHIDGKSGMHYKIKFPI